ncbi:MAG TPA: hypothetical protein VIV60_17600 [Polyangiaceae bacterium]
MMNRRQQLFEWQRTRRRVQVPNGFASEVMLAIQGEVAQRSSARSRRATWLSALALAAAVLFVVLCQAGSIGLGLVALAGVAQ